MRLFLVIALSLTAAACKTGSSVAQKKSPALDSSKVVLSMTAPVVVYKTRQNYNHLVPITLSEDKEEIDSYPDPSDLTEENNYGKPIELEDGYLLDRRGVQQHTAFVQITYEEYAQLETPPSMEELKQKIVDKNPFLELYQCGYQSQYPDVVQELNRLIRKKELEKICEKR